ncbi:MAG: DedA family protein [Candidatus Aminicenantes bacterium]|nr:DedA family protein [Candidatus Aminicenantes bacterium]
MELIGKLFAFIMHIDIHLNTLIVTYQLWTYLILFAIIFCETGLVITPFLPGDSLLFATGALAATAGSPLKVYWLFLVLAVAAVLGDTVNYWIGHAIGPKIFSQKKIRFLKKEHLERTHQFYEKHGGITIVLARFIPIIRTFAPFVAGIGRMSYWRFIAFNFFGGVAWVALFVFGGYFFGNLPLVKRNFTIVVLAIIFISILPGVIEYVRQRRNNKREK